jgi:hypothetical protein
MSDNLHCPSCGEKKACGQHHVYAIELMPEVLTDKKFRELTGVEEGFTGRCFYVGQTSHQVACRYKQHKAKRRPPRRGFNCSCKNGTEVFEKFSPYNRGNRFVRKYAFPFGLRPKLFRHLNPISGGEEAAKREEKKLALELRAKGFAVHFK